MTQIQPTRINAVAINAMQDEMAGAISPAAPASDELHALAASANRIDMIIGVFAIGVLFGTWIA